jgi:hypothetical protein
VHPAHQRLAAAQLELRRLGVDRDVEHAGDDAEHRQQAQQAGKLGIASSPASSRA